MLELGCKHELPVKALVCFQSLLRYSPLWQSQNYGAIASGSLTHWLAVIVV